MPRVGAVSYLNTLPLVFGMQRGAGVGRVELSFDHPAGLADAMSRGELDVALMPVIELARMPELELVPGLSISTLGAARSVLLVSRCPMERIETVALDPQSRTSNVLVQVLFAESWRRAATFRASDARLDVALSECDAAVRIGDKALFEPLPDGATVFDLGAEWTTLTGLPFVFAAWFARAGVVDRELYRLLHDSRRQGVRSIERIAADYTWRGESHAERAREYLERHIRFRLGAEELRAMRLFFAAARAIGAIEREPEVHMALQRWTTCDEVAAQQATDAR